MTTAPFDIVREALLSGSTIEQIEQAIAALDSIRDRYLPLEMLPDGFYVYEMYQNPKNKLWYPRLARKGGSGMTPLLSDKTPNAAFLAAVKAIGGGE